MDYEALTQEERDLLLAEELYVLEREHFQFAIQVERESQLLESLPRGDWPADIKYLRGLGRDEIIRKANNDADADLAHKYHYRDWLMVRMKSAAVERGRVERAREAAILQLPETRRAEALEQARLKRESGV